MMVDKTFSIIGIVLFIFLSWFYSIFLYTEFFDKKGLQYSLYSPYLISSTSIMVYMSTSFLLSVSLVFNIVYTLLFKNSNNYMNINAIYRTVGDDVGRCTAWGFVVACFTFPINIVLFPPFMEGLDIVSFLVSSSVIGMFIGFSISLLRSLSFIFNESPSRAYSFLILLISWIIINISILRTDIVQNFYAVQDAYWHEKYMKDDLDLIDCYILLDVRDYSSVDEDLCASMIINDLHNEATINFYILWFILTSVYIIYIYIFKVRYKINL